MATFPAKLSDKVATLLILGVRQHGSFDPDLALMSVEESFTIPEWKQASAFLGWIHAQGLVFGHGNIQSRYREFLAAQRVVK